MPGRIVYSIWVIASIAFFFLLLIIPLVICATFPKLHRSALHLNRMWAWGFFRLAALPVRAEWHFTPRKQEQYILCANHFSYLDIPCLGLFPQPFKFVGKSQLSKIPLFGYMYNKIHITVNRSSYRSRAQSLQKARIELKKGFNLGFFPEGGIRLSRYPEMVDFKDGAFRLSAESGVPIVPITFLDNYFILPDDQLLRMQRGRCRIIYHEPVPPKGTTDEQIRRHKEEVFNVIQEALNNESVVS